MPNALLANTANNNDDRGFSLQAASTDNELTDNNACQNPGGDLVQEPGSAGTVFTGNDFCTVF